MFQLQCVECAVRNWWNEQNQPHPWHQDAQGQQMFQPQQLHQDAQGQQMFQPQQLHQDAQGSLQV